MDFYRNSIGPFFTCELVHIKSAFQAGISLAKAT